MAPSSVGHGEEGHTPTAEESKLPSTTQGCPPAPRKPGSARRCKRRLWPEAELIEIGAEEMEQVFGWRVPSSPSQYDRAMQSVKPLRCLQSLCVCEEGVLEEAKKAKVRWRNSDE
ncbi:hypothetical protein MUK42_17105 [Musa troglodytarum]|nr:hypothetical protein MUK42_17105 [Musa troglodytarum]